MIDGTEYIKPLCNLNETLYTQLTEVGTEEWGSQFDGLTIEGIDFTMFDEEPTITIRVGLYTKMDSDKKKHTYRLLIPSKYLFDVGFIKGAFFTSMLLEDEIINE